MEKETFYAGINLQKLHDIIVEDDMDDDWDDVGRAYVNFISKCNEKMAQYDALSKHMLNHKGDNPGPEYGQTLRLSNEMFDAYKTLRDAAVKVEKMYMGIVKPEELAAEMRAKKDALSKEFEEILANIEKPEHLDTLRCAINAVAQISGGKIK